MEEYAQAMPMSQQGFSTGGIDAESALKLSETQKEIKIFILDKCGLHIVKDETGKKEVLKRFKAPAFSYEFAKELMDGLFMQINRITARTTFDGEQIRQYNEVYADALGMWFAQEGMRNLVSAKVWQIALEMEKNGEWKDVIGYDWTYHDQFTVDMLNYIRENYNLLNEGFGQNVILRRIKIECMFFIHGGRNRALNHLTLNHEKTIYSESRTVTPDPTQKQGFFSRIGAALGGLGSNERR